jgi:hypothetical protein
LSWKIVRNLSKSVWILARMPLLCRFWRFNLRFWNFVSLRWIFLEKKLAYSLVFNKWKVYTRPTSATDFYFHHIWNILKALVSLQKFWTFFFAQIMFLPINSQKTWKKPIKNFRLSRVVAAAVDRNLCPTYSLDHKT